MSELDIKAKDLLDGKLFQLSFSKNIFATDALIINKNDQYS